MKNDDDKLTDHDLFKKAMQGVTPLKTTNKNLNKTPQPKKSLLKSLGPALEPKIALSDHCPIDILPEQYINFAIPGIQPKYLRQLKQGKIPIDSELDLHGYSVDQARERLVEFIDFAVKQNYRCVRIIHGKGYRGPSKTPLLKSKTYTWLMQLPSIIAFNSCQPKDGGTGAVYVLLKRHRP